MDSVKKCLRKANAKLAVIPGGCTSVLQPLDVSVNKPFKGWLCTSWSTYIQGVSERVRSEQEASVQAKIRPPTKQQIVDWIGSALEKLRGKPNLIRKSFVVTGIAPAMNRSQDHLIRQDDDTGDSCDEEFLGFESELSVHAVASHLSDVSLSDVSDVSDD